MQLMYSLDIPQYRHYYYNAAVRNFGNKIFIDSVKNAKRRPLFQFSDLTMLEMVKKADSNKKGNNLFSACFWVHFLHGCSNVEETCDESTTLLYCTRTSLIFIVARSIFPVLDAFYSTCRIADGLEHRLSIAMFRSLMHG
jgi:hypothetical protein